MALLENVTQCAHVPAAGSVALLVSCPYNHNSSGQWPIAFYDVVKGHEDGSTGRRKISKDSKSNTVEAKKVVSCWFVCLYLQY